MTSPLLLDCTLRDGGYINDWDFGLGSIQSIISRLDCAGVDIIEVGFIDESRAYDENRAIFPDTKSILPVFQNIAKPKASVIGMINYGTCGIDKISDRSESCLDGIRLIFKKKDQDGAIEFLKQIGGKGYKMFANPVSITGYSEEETLALIEKINKIKPYAVSVVDTYGLMHSKELLSYFDIFDQNLEKDIILGYHAHNNFQMAYANSIILMNRDIGRAISIDGTLYGMGRGAGNACTELLAMYMNEFRGRNFNIHQIQEAIDIDILKEYDKNPWGYNFECYIAAQNDCLPFHAQYLLGKKTLSVKAVCEILQRIDADKKLAYDKDHVEKIYNEYQERFCDDTLAVELLTREFSGKKILLLGPGKTLQDNFAAINDFVRENKPAIVSINFLNESLPIDYVFMGNAKRYSQFFHKIYEEDRNVKIICTSNITEAGRKIDFTVNYSSLLADDPVIRENPLVMFLKLLKNIGINEVWMAGFDGYVNDNSVNYYGEYVKFLYCQDDVVLRNEAIKKELQGFSRSMRISSLTPTRYL
jgi:4-hydroxy 2-oxovalerate aldolase